MVDRWDAIVIGAGISGLSVGALLANSGLKVLVLEKNGYLGGRCSKMEHEGFTFDSAGHAFGGEGFVEDVYARVGKPLPRLLPITSFKVFVNNRWTDLREIIPRDEVRKICKEIVAMPDEKIEELDATSLKDWVGERSSNEDLHRFFWALGQLYLVANKYENAVARDVLLVIKDCLTRRGSQQGFWVEGGSHKLNEPLAEAINEKGGKVLLDTEVDEVIVKNGVVQGITIKKAGKGRYWIAEGATVEAPVVVCTVPLWSLFNVVSEEHFPGWYVDRVKNIMRRTTHIYTVLAGMEKPAWNESGYRIYMDNPRCGLVSVGVEFSHFHKMCVPEGKGLVGMTYQGSYEELPDLFEANRAAVKNQVNHVFDLLVEELEETVDDFKKNCLWTLRDPGRFGLAQEPGLTGRFRPDVKPPSVRGFYLASDTVRTRGVGVHAAAYSALTCFERIKGDYKR
jgi:phytoene dehydrogenase-like protein